MTDLLPEDMTPEIRHALNKGFKTTAKGTTYYDAGESWNALKAELNRRAPSPIIPAGWKLVPVEPTREMEAAADRINERSQIDNYGKDARPDDIYAVMLAAAPPAPALDEAREREWPDRMADQLRDIETLLTIVAPRSHMREYQRTLTEVRVLIQEYEAAKRHARGESARR